MARSNEEIARQSLRMWSEGDLDGTLESMHEEVVWHLAFELPDLPRGKVVYTGHEEVRQVWDAFRSVWDTIALEIDEVIVDRDELLVGRATFTGRAGGSGIELERTVFYVLRIEDELLREIQPFDTLDEARAAAGLDE